MTPPAPPAEPMPVADAPPSPPAEPDATDGAPLAGWRIVAASATGASHAADGTPCQDAFAVRVLPDGVVVVAVADGAGSAALSERGAAAAVEAALHALGDAFSGGRAGESVESAEAAMPAAFAEAREAVAHLAAAEGWPLADYAATLSCLVVAPNAVVAGRIGDGFAVVESADGRLRALPAERPSRGEYANETTFLTGDGALDRLEVASLAITVRSAAVSTDGLLRLAMELPAYQPFPRFFGPLFGFAAADEAAGSGPPAVERLAAFLGSDRVRARTDDDVTLVLVVRADPPAEPTEPVDGANADSARPIVSSPR